MCFILLKFVMHADPICPSSRRKTFIIKFLRQYNWLIKNKNKKKKKQEPLTAGLTQFGLFKKNQVIIKVCRV